MPPAAQPPDEPRPERGRRVRLHWTHPDWRPWRRYLIREPRARGPRGDDAVPVVDGVRLVKLPWTHPRWRPWRRYAKAEVGTPGVERALDQVLGERVPWGRVVLFAALAAALVASGVLGVRWWRDHAGPTGGEESGDR